MIFSAILSILSSLIMMLVVIACFKQVLVVNNDKLFIKFLAYLFTVDIALWFLMPATLRLFSNGQYEKELGIFPYEISFVYFVEMISTIIFFIVISVFMSRGRYRISFHPKHLLNFISFQGDRVSLYQSKVLFFSSLGCLIVLLDGNFFGVISPFIPAIIAESANKFFLAFFVSYIFLSDISKFKFYFSILILFFMVLLDGIKGSHGSIVWPMIVLYFLVNTVKKFKSINFAIVLVVIMLAIFYKPLHDLREYEYSLSEKLSPLERILLIASPSDIPVDTSQTQSGLIDDIEWRFGENTRMSVGYLRMHERGFKGGVMPIENTLHILPRSIVSDKPAPASIDGKITGMGMYLMHKEMRGTTYNMSGMSAGMHDYWLGGWTGVLLGAVIVGAWYSLILSILLRFSGLALPVVIAIHDTWWQMPKIWSTEAIIISTNTIPLILLWLVLGLFTAFLSKQFLNVMKQLIIFALSPSIIRKINKDSG
jgi:hypothetical protein